MIEDRLTLKLAMDHLFGVSERTGNPAVRDLLEQAIRLIETADALIVNDNTLRNSNS